MTWGGLLAFHQNFIQLCGIRIMFFGNLLRVKPMIIVGARVSAVKRQDRVYMSDLPAVWLVVNKMSTPLGRLGTLTCDHRSVARQMR
jgi:hypothetical protein